MLDDYYIFFILVWLRSRSRAIFLYLFFVYFVPSICNPSDVFFSGAHSVLNWMDMTRKYGHIGIFVFTRCARSRTQIVIMGCTANGRWEYFECYNNNNACLCLLACLSACCQPALRFNTKKYPQKRKRKEKNWKKYAINLFVCPSCIYFFSSVECVVLLVPFSGIKLFVRIVELKIKTDR